MVVLAGHQERRDKILVVEPEVVVPGDDAVAIEAAAILCGQHGIGWMRGAKAEEVRHASSRSGRILANQTCSITAQRQQSQDEDFPASHPDAHSAVTKPSSVEQTV